MELFLFAGLIVIWFLLLMWGAKYVEYLWHRALGSRMFRVMVAPGIIVHEYSHAAACLLTGTEIKEIKLFKKDGGHVVHEVPKPSLLGIPFLAASRKGGALHTNFISSALIAYAPLAGCLLVLWGTGLLVNAITDEDVSPVAEQSSNNEAAASQVAASTGDFGAFLTDLGAYVGTSFESLLAPFDQNWIVGLIYAWLLLSLTICMAPSTQDLKNARSATVILTVLLVGASIVLAQNEAWLQDAISGILPPIGYTAALMLIALGASTVVATVLMQLRRSTTR